MKNTNDLFAKNLRALREKNKLDQADVAEAVGVNVRTYQDYEYGKVTPSEKKKAIIADFLKVAVSELYKDDRPQFIQVQTTQSRSENLTLLYSIAPQLTDHDLQTLVNLASSYPRK